MKILFVTGNQGKADRLAKYLDIEVDHQKLDLDEIQSLDTREIVKRKALQAFEIAKRPVLVDDVSLEIESLNGLPGPLIRWFLDTISTQQICDMVSGNRKAVGRCVMAYYDGGEVEFFEGFINGTIPGSPRGDQGFGWDPIFVPDGYTQTRAEMNDIDQKKVYLQIRRFDQLKDFLSKLD